MGTKSAFGFFKSGLEDYMSGAKNGISGYFDVSTGKMAGKIADGLEKIDPYADKIAKAVTSPLAKKIGVGAAITAGLGATAYGIHSAYDYLDKKF